MYIHFLFNKILTLKRCYNFKANTFPFPVKCIIILFILFFQGIKSKVRTSSGMFLSPQEKKFPMIQVVCFKHNSPIFYINEGLFCSHCQICGLPFILHHYPGNLWHIPVSIVIRKNNQKCIHIFLYLHSLSSKVSSIIKQLLCLDRIWINLPLRLCPTCTSHNSYIEFATCLFISFCMGVRVCKCFSWMLTTYLVFPPSIKISNTWFRSGIPVWLLIFNAQKIGWSI